MMNFDIPEYLMNYLQDLDNFIESEIMPLQMQDDNNRFFDHRREDARTDWDRNGLPNEQWEELLTKAKQRADAAGHFRFSSPKEYGGKDGSNLEMAIIREHLACRGLGLHNDLQNEHSIVGNNVGLLLMIEYGSAQQKIDWIDDLCESRRYFTFGITETAHGSDATHMGTFATRNGDTWLINGEKSWNTGIHRAGHILVIARTSGDAGDAGGLTAFLVPTDTQGFKIEEMLWTFNMPTDHGRVSFTEMKVPHSCILGSEGKALQVVHISLMKIAFAKLPPH